ncbi:translation initiation factor eIF-2B subunit alpha [Hanseniaspora osmophila]
MSEAFSIKDTYLHFLEQDPEMTMPIAAIESLITLLQHTQPSTSAEMIQVIHKATAELTRSIPNSISLKAGCDIFSRFVLKNTHELSKKNDSKDWETFKQHLIENGQLFIDRAKQSREKIASIGADFIRDGDIILVHGYSRAVSHLLSKAAERLIRFRCIVTESRPTDGGLLLCKQLQEHGVVCNMIVDSGVGSIIHKVDKIMVGAEGVTESGGVINLIGTCSIAVLARNAKKPFYVVSESHKFVRMFPLSSNDLPSDKDPLKFSSKWDGQLSSPLLDFTSYDYITALITDLGVQTPSAVSEELMKMWYD